MSSDVTVRVTDVVVRSASSDVVVRSAGPAIVAAGGSGPAGPVWAGAYGSFYSSSNQTIATVDTAQPVTFTNAFTASNVSVVSSSRLTLALVGTYAMTFVGQLHNPTNDVQSATFWLRLNGNDYPNSATHVSLSARKNNGDAFEQLVTITFVGTSVAPNDYVQVMWLGSSTQLGLLTKAAGTSPVYPAAPSAMVSFGQVA